MRTRVPTNDRIWPSPTVASPAALTATFQSVEGEVGVFEGDVETGDAAIGLAAGGPDGGAREDRNVALRHARTDRRLNVGLGGRPVRLTDRVV